MVAACLGVEWAGCYYGLKMGYDEGLRNCGPGHQILSSVIADCAQRGVSTIFLGGKMDSYKRHWTADTERKLTVFVFNSALRSQIVFQEKRWLFPTLRRLQSKVFGRLRKS